MKCNLHLLSLIFQSDFFSNFFLVWCFLYRELSWLIANIVIAQSVDVCFTLGTRILLGVVFDLQCSAGASL